MSGLHLLVLFLAGTAVALWFTVDQRFEEAIVTLLITGCFLLVGLADLLGEIIEVLKATQERKSSRELHAHENREDAMKRAFGLAMATTHNKGHATYLFRRVDGACKVVHAQSASSPVPEPGSDREGWRGGPVMPVAPAHPSLPHHP